MMSEYPASVEMEKYLLGTMLMYDGATIPAITSALTEEDFLRPQHSIIYQAINELVKNGKPVTMITVAEHLRLTGKLDQVDIGYLLMLPELVNTSAYVEHYVKVVKQKSDYRRLIKAAREIATGAAQELRQPSDLIGEFKEKFKEVGKPRVEVHLTEESGYRNLIDFIASRQDFTERKTGFSNLDAVQRFIPGLYVIGAVPGAGKTTFCCQMAQQMAAKGEDVYYFTYEMSRYQLWAKMAARQMFMRHRTYAPFVNKIMDGEELEEVYGAMIEFAEAIEESGGSLKVIECPPDFTVDEIINTVQVGAKKPIVFIDYLQKVDADKDTRRDKADYVVKRLKYHQLQEDVTYVLISAFNRQSYYTAGSMDSSKESGGIEYEADVYWTLQLSVVAKMKSEKKLDIIEATREALKERPRKVELTCLKYRDGANYECTFHFFSGNAYFEPAEEAEVVEYRV